MAEATQRVDLSNKERLRELAEGEGEPTLTVEQFEAVEMDRVRFSLFMALICESIPRRLGKDADAWALALDKQLARKVANCYRSLWKAMDSSSAPAWNSRAERMSLAAAADTGQRRAGATVRWGAWLRERHEGIAQIMSRAAALAVLKNRTRWGISRVRLLEIERDNIRRIINEVVGRTGRLKGGKDHE